MSIHNTKTALLFMLYALVLPAAQLPWLSADARMEKVEVTVSPERLVPGNTGEIKVTYHMPSEYHQTLQKEYFFFEASPGDKVTLGPIRYPEGIQENGETQYYNEVTLTADITPHASINSGELSFTLTHHYQLCDEAGTCYFPEETETTHTISLSPPQKSGNFLYFLLLAFAGGLLLNIMPCVLPVLSIRALNLVNQSNSDRRTMRKAGIAYTLGILITLAGLGAIIILLKSAGEAVGWGFQFQNPLFVSVLGGFILLLAFSLFDLFVIPIPGISLKGKKGSTVSGNLLNGFLAVLLATPCSAPFLGTALGFAFTQPPLIILGIFLMVGFGFALPFFLLGFWPKALHFIPTPGKWMHTFKEIMGFLLIATTLYLLSSLYYQISGTAFIEVLLFYLVIAFASWILGKLYQPVYVKKIRISGVVLFLVLLLMGGMLWLPGKETSASALKMSDPSENAEIDQKTFSPETLSRLREEGTPVFLHFTAKWCSVCKLNDARVFSTPKAEELFEMYGVTTLYGDNTNRDEELTLWIESFGKAGVPVYVLYPPGEDAIVLPEIISLRYIEELFAQELEENDTPSGSPLPNSKLKTLPSGKSE